MSTRQEETPKTYFKSNTATVRGLMSFLSIMLLIVVVGLCAYVLISYKGIRKNQTNNAQQFNFHFENKTATILEFCNFEATKCVIPEIVISDNQEYRVTALSEKAFANHSNLREVEIPDSVTHIMGNAEIGKGAFSGCVNLQTVKLGNGIKDIGAYSFKNCFSLEKIEIPASVCFVEERAFQNCLSLQTIQLDSNGSLGSNCFENCVNVTTLKLADTVVLSPSALKEFAGMTKLSNFIISETNPHYYYDADANCLLSHLDSQNVVLVLAGCKTFIPANVTIIGDYVWGERAVGNIFIPETVLEITENAFRNQTIYTDATQKPAGWVTTVPVFTNARNASFIAKGQSVKACIYLNDREEIVAPAYEDLFPDLVTETPLSSKTNRMKLSETLFETFNVCRYFHPY